MRTHAKHITKEALKKKAQLYYVRDMEGHPMATVCVYKQKNGKVSRGIAIKSISENHNANNYNKEYAHSLAIDRLYLAIQRRSTPKMLPYRGQLDSPNEIKIKFETLALPGVGMLVAIDDKNGQADHNRLITLFNFIARSKDEYEASKMHFKSEYGVVPTAFEQKLLS